MFVTNYNPSSEEGKNASVLMETALNMWYLLFFLFI